MVVNGKSLFEASPIKNMINVKVKEHGVSHGLAEVGYDIRIKQEIVFTPTDYRMDICYPHEAVKVYPPKVAVGGVTTLGNFVIASALEEFDMPNDLVGIVHDKSTWARRGLSVFNTVIEPGWNGFLTLELVFHGSEPLHIPAGAGIAQVIFHKIAHPAAYTGKYQSQVDEPVPSVFE